MKTIDLLLALLLTACIAFGCAGTSHRRSHHAKLSEAMEKASDDHQGHRRIDTETRRPYSSRPNRIEAPHRIHDPEPSATVPPVAPSPSSSVEKEPWHGVAPGPNRTLPAGFGSTAQHDMLGFPD